MNRPCIDCGTPTTGTRCRPHRTQHNRARRQRRPDLHTHSWRKQSQATIKQWVAQNGWVCPGWGTHPHPSRDLTTHHTDGPAHPDSLTVLCRSCNSREGQARQHTT